jgi:hypothetical protein
MAQARVDRLAQLLAALYPGQDPPFADHTDLYSTIDAIQQGDVPWESFSVQYSGPLPEGEVPEWMTQKYEVWFRSPLGIFEKQLANPDFKDEIDWAPKRIFKDGKRQFVDLFSGNWAWKQAVRIYSATKHYLFNDDFRMKSPKIPTLTARCLYLVSSGATRRPSLLGLGTRSFIHCTVVLGIFSMEPAALIVMVSQSWLFFQFPKVRISFSTYSCADPL